MKKEKNAHTCALTKKLDETVCSLLADAKAGQYSALLLRKLNPSSPAFLVMQGAPSLQYLKSIQLR